MKISVVLDPSWLLLLPALQFYGRRPIRGRELSPEPGVLPSASTRFVLPAPFICPTFRPVQPNSPLSEVGWPFSPRPRPLEAHYYKGPTILRGSSRMDAYKMVGDQNWMSMQKSTTPHFCCCFPSKQRSEVGRASSVCLLSIGQWLNNLKGARDD